MDWYFVHIEHMRLTEPLDKTFVTLLMDEYRTLSQPQLCRVYCRTHPDGSFTYFFSPPAAKSMQRFISFWGGVKCSEPTNLNQMAVII